MNGHRTAIVVLLMAAAVPAGAQEAEPECMSADIPLQDACQKGVDIMRFIMPQFSTVVTGGSAVVGQVGTLGGPGHFTLEARANGLAGQLPDVAAVAPSLVGPQRSDYPTAGQLYAFATATAAIGLFEGTQLPSWPIGSGRVAGFDLLVSATYVPVLERGDVGVRPLEGSLRFGAGARIGLLDGEGLLPSISVSFLRRRLPSMDIVTTTLQDTIAIRDLQVSTDAWRIVVGKSLPFIDLAGGVGWDRYSSVGDLELFVHDASALGGPIDHTGSVAGFSQALTRRNFFLDAAIRLAGLQLVGEVGRVMGGDVPTYNTYSGRAADDPYNYAALSFRLGY